MPTLANASPTEPADQYIKTFTWNKVIYRADKPLAELIDSLQKVSLVSEEGVRLNSNTDFSF